MIPAGCRGQDHVDGKPRASGDDPEDEDDVVPVNV